MKLAVRDAVARDLDDRGPAVAERVSERVAEAVGVEHSLVPAFVERRETLEPQTGRRRDVLLERVRLTGDRQEVEDAAAVVVEQHDRQLQPGAPGGEQPARVVGERDVADQQHDRPATFACRGRYAERGRDGPVDPVGAAVGQQSRRVGADWKPGLDVAHRHRGGDDQRRFGREHLPERPCDERLGQSRRGEQRP